MAVPTAPVAAGSLVAGFGVAVATGVRPLGGLALAAGTAWCAREWVRRGGPGLAAGLVGAELVAFAASHVLAPRLGAWPSVLLVALVAGTAAWAFADRRPARTRSRPA